MSRAEMALEWLVNLYNEFFGFFGYYVGAGLELWGDWRYRTAGLIVAGLVTWAFCGRRVWINNPPGEDNPQIRTSYDRFMQSLIFGLPWGFLATLFFSWPVLNLLLGFFFGPIRP